MEKREVGSTAVVVSVVGIGTFPMGGLDSKEGLGCGWGGVDDDTSIRVLHRAEELGINLVDTADIYGNGHSEEVIGRALAGRRSRWVIATKVGLVKDPNRRGRLEDFSADHIRSACEQSLHRLRTDHIDFYQLHGTPPRELIPQVVEALSRLRTAGKIRFWGISTASPEDVVTLRQHDAVDVVQVGYSLVDRSEQPLLEYCEKESLGTFIRTPLSRGAAFGKYASQTAPTFEWGDNRHGMSAEKLLEQHRPGLSFSFLWDDTGRSPVQAALRFVLDQPGVTAVIPGMKTLEQLEDDAAAGCLSPLTCLELERCASV